MDVTNPIIKTLLENHEEFRTLFAEHKDLEHRLEAMDSIHHLTEAEDIERKRLQKIKLHGRDRMEEIILHARNGAPAS